MASTSTNKQPLLIDRALYESVNSWTGAAGLASGVSSGSDHHRTD